MSGKFKPGTTEPIGICGKFASYIDYVSDLGEPWFERIRVLGRNPEQAEDMRDHILSALSPEHSAPAWVGIGLPPAGLEVEWKQGSNHEWVRSKVIAYFKDEAWISVEGDRPIIVGNPGQFRLIRTPEQIAAEEREKAIEEMAMEIAGYNGFDDVREVDSRLAEHLHDQNFRKQVAL